MESSAIKRWALLSTSTWVHEFGFSRNQQIPLGVLPGEQFLGIMQSGLVPKDLGAGITHGEWSHPLQWAAIGSQFATDTRARQGGREDAPQWNHVPLELMRKLGDERFGWLQGSLMDKAKATREEGYTGRDSITHMMRSDAETRATLPNISNLVTGGNDEGGQKEFTELVTKPGKGRKSLPDLYRAHKAQEGGWTEDKPQGVSSNLLYRPDAPVEASLDDRIRQQRLKWGFGLA